MGKKKKKLKVANLDATFAEWLFVHVKEFQRRVKKLGVTRPVRFLIAGKEHDQPWMLKRIVKLLEAYFADPSEGYDNLIEAAKLWVKVLPTMWI